MIQKKSFRQKRFSINLHQPKTLQFTECLKMLSLPIRAVSSKAYNCRKIYALQQFCNYLIFQYYFMKIKNVLDINKTKGYQ